SSGKATPKEIIDIINKYTDENTIVTTDVGQHQMWVAQYYNFKLPKQLISSGGFGTMGFGLGAAIGAKIANPDKLVIHCTGDGSFRMNYTEYATAKYYDVPIITVLFNNRALGMVRQWQALTAGRRFSQTTLDRGPDFVKFAQAFDFEAVKVSTKEDFDREFAKAVKSGKHYMIECDIETEDLVSPMIPGGAKSDEFLLD
ncbi:MAG: acetolactate synthase large subunit, partial [Clostridia bacterium]|nr:acetolactate synthase large subunit [Clostridia bacterium]